MATIISQKAPLVAAPSLSEPGAHDASPALIPRNRPERRTANARGRDPNRFVQRGESHPEAPASRSRPIRPRMAANSWRGTAASANWNTTYLACLTTFAPILTSFSRSESADLPGGLLSGPGFEACPPTSDVLAPVQGEGLPA